jgi:hypothetical protein
MRPRDHIETAKLFSEVVWALLGVGLACWLISLAVFAGMGEDVLLILTFMATPWAIPVFIWCLYRVWWHRREAAL